MSSPKLHDAHIQSVVQIVTSRELRSELPHTPVTSRTVVQGREAVERVIDRDDHRLLAVVGPCSIHDLDAASEYARRLSALAVELKESLLIIMRVYFEKPRTSLGWKGLINDPYLNDTFRIDEGLRKARRFLLDVANLNLPVATEALDPLMPQYIGDLISWTAIGARTTESQTHREIASGLSTAVGFKNATDGSFDAAINAIKAALGPHHFLGVTEEGHSAVYGTTGNPYPHIVLRGGAKPNYDAESIVRCEHALQKAGLPAAILVDCSHGNSNKNHDLQPTVLDNIVSQIEAGNRSIIGFMIESNLYAGTQPIAKNLADLKYGVSVTDACIDWPTTENALRSAAERLKDLLPQRIATASQDRPHTGESP